MGRRRPRREGCWGPATKQKGICAFIGLDLSAHLTAVFLKL